MADAVGIVSLGVTVVGLGVAFWQIRRTQNAAAAAVSAIELQQRRTANGLLLSRSGELEEIEERLRVALSARQRRAATQAVVDWRRLAADFQGLLEGAGNPYPDLHDHLALSLGVISYALRDLGNVTISPSDACSRLLPHVSDSCVQLRQASSAIILGSET